MKEEQISGLEIDLVINEFDSCHLSVVHDIHRKKELDETVEPEEVMKQEEVTAEKIAGEKTITTDLDFIKEEQLSGLEIDLVINEFDSCHLSVVHDIHRKKELDANCYARGGHQTRGSSAEKIAEEKTITTDLDFIKQEQISGLEIDLVINEFDSCHLSVVHDIHRKKELDETVEPEEVMKQEEVTAEKIAEEKTITTDLDFIKEEQLSGLEIDLVINEFDSCHLSVVHDIHRKKELDATVKPEEVMKQEEVTAEKIAEEKTITTDLDFIKEEQISGLEIDLVINEFDSCHLSVVHDIHRKKELDETVKPEEVMKQEEVTAEKIAEEKTITTDLDFMKEEQISGLEIDLVINEFDSCHMSVVHDIHRKKELDATVEPEEVMKQEEVTAEKIAEEKTIITDLDFIKEEQISGLEIDLVINEFDSCHLSVVHDIHRKKELDETVKPEEVMKQEEVTAEKIAEEKTITTDLDFMKEEQISGLEIDLVINEFDSCHMSVVHDIHRKKELDATVKPEEVMKQEEVTAEKIAEEKTIIPIWTSSRRSRFLVLRSIWSSMSLIVAILSVVHDIHRKKELDETVKPEEVMKQEEVTAEKIAEEKTITTDLDFMKEEQISGLEIDLVINEFDSCHMSVVHDIHRKKELDATVKPEEVMKQEEVTAEKIAEEKTIIPIWTSSRRSRFLVLRSIWSSMSLTVAI
ncbi:hypothetical protein KIN20_018677 [Parelaphostrongylus tenuis]|uniref:Uncharacterized protein n=1 Tax=Parelaphostrongylus tenuis TaxID=148309 RepID=A0AAD5QSC3_PARTN|nr:hypothetical protein KIN20_018677 [Parelaphostrongylus tenuis]